MLAFGAARSMTAEAVIWEAARPASINAGIRAGARPVSGRPLRFAIRRGFRRPSRG